MTRRPRPITPAGWAIVALLAILITQILVRL